MTKTSLTIAAAVLIAAGTAVYHSQKQPFPASLENGKQKDQPRMASVGSSNKTIPTKSSSIRKPSGKSAESQIRDEAKRQFAETMKGVSNTTKKAIATYQQAKLKGRIQKLTEALSLNDPQKAKLLVWLDERMSMIDTLDLEDEAATSALLKSLTTQAMDAEMQNSLTAEQTMALDEFRRSENFKSVNAMALKDLSFIQDSVEFEGDQQERVYEILANEASRKIQQQSENPSPEMLMGDIREQGDPYGLGIDQALSEEATRNPSGTPDFRKVIDQQIAARVESFRSVLNDQQIEQFRNHLKTKTEESYGAFIELMEGALNEK